MQGTRNEKIKSLQTMRNTIKEESSPTTATSSGQDIQAHVTQSDGDITLPIRPRGKANVGPTNAVHPSSRPIRRPRTPPPRPARHQRDPTATATKGHKTMPVDPFEIGHAAAYFDEHIAGEASVDPQHLSDLCLAEVSMSLMLRFDEATKIQYVRVDGVWSFVLLTFSLVCAPFVFSLHGLR